MFHLILVKHSLPDINPAIPSQQWRLSDEGVRRCTWLAESLETYNVTQIVSSAEPKAKHTAELVAKHLGLTNTAHQNLHENDRTNVPFLERETFEQNIRLFFDNPEELIMGAETARQAQERFAKELEAILKAASGTVVVVAHGTVNTLFTALHNAVEPFELWASLQLPSYIVLDQADFSWKGEVYTFPG